jgi:transcriptional regulator with XRE-family HTH domain
VIPLQIGNRIKAIRKERGITQTGLALKAGISRTYLADIEGNRYAPSLKILGVIAEALNLKVSELIEDEEMELSESYIKVMQSAKKTGIKPERLAALIEFLSKE